MFYPRWQPFGYRNYNNRCCQQRCCNNTCNGRCNPGGSCNVCGPGSSCGPCNTCGPGNSCGPCNTCGPGNSCGPCNTCGPGNSCGSCNSCGTCNTCNPCCNSKFDPPCGPTPPCPCYNEADYTVDVIDHLFEEYNEIERKADFNFANAVIKLGEAIECLNVALQCNKEGYVVWVKMEKWLARYYERFGVYCGCPERMIAIRECVAKLLVLERAGLEQAMVACKSLEESRVLDEELHVIKRAFYDCCLPKC